MNAPRLSAIAWMLIGLALVFPSAAFGVHLEFVAEVPGTILDVTPKRILYSVSENGRERLRILDRSTRITVACSTGWRSELGAIERVRGLKAIREGNADRRSSVVMNDDRFIRRSGFVRSER